MRIEREKNKKREKKKKEKEKMTCLRRLSSPRRPRLGKIKYRLPVLAKILIRNPPKKIERHFPKVFRKKTHAHTRTGRKLFFFYFFFV